MARNKIAQTIHPEIADFEFFKVEDNPLFEDIGLRVRFIAPRCPIEEEDFTIIGVQRDYKKQLCYRVCEDSDTKYRFGRPAHPNQIYFINTKGVDTDEQ